MRHLPFNLAACNERQLARLIELTKRWFTPMANEVLRDSLLSRLQADHHKAKHGMPPNDSPMPWPELSQNEVHNATVAMCAVHRYHRPGTTAARYLDAVSAAAADAIEWQEIETE